MSRKNDIDRRQFLTRAAGSVFGAVGFPYIISSSALGAAETVAPSNRITLGFIGTGKQGNEFLLSGFLNHSAAQVIAVCDVDALKRKRSRYRVEKHYAGRLSKGVFKGCTAYGDFRDLLARDDIDAVVIATPDHWHGIVVIHAAKSGKDIYCEKPLSFTIAEARDMVSAVRGYSRILQTGSMQRSDYRFRFACELVRNGYIGEVKKVSVNIGNAASAYPIFSEECYLPAEPVPDYLDWDMWLGPAPWRPYNSILSPDISNNIYPHWRNYRDYSGGLMTDWGAHHFDIAQWGLGMDETGPVEIVPPDGKNYRELTYKYANGVTMTRRDKGRRGILFVGTEGKVEVNREYLHTWPGSLKNEQIGPNQIHLYESGDHYANWLKCIRTRSKPICDVEIGARSATVCHLGNIAYRLGRPLKWDPKNERFVNDEQADRMLSRPMRSPWHL